MLKPVRKIPEKHGALSKFDITNNSHNQETKNKSEKEKDEHIDRKYVHMKKKKGHSNQHH